MDVDAFLDSITPEQMDRIEAQFVVTWQREALVQKHLMVSLLAVQGCEMDWDAIESVAPDWFPEE